MIEDSVVEYPTDQPVVGPGDKPDEGRSVHGRLECVPGSYGQVRPRSDLPETSDEGLGSHSEVRIDVRHRVVVGARPEVAECLSPSLSSNIRMYDQLREPE